MINRLFKSVSNLESSANLKDALLAVANVGLVATFRHPTNLTLVQALSELNALGIKFNGCVRNIPDVLQHDLGEKLRRGVSVDDFISQATLESPVEPIRFLSEDEEDDEDDFYRIPDSEMEKVCYQYAQAVRTILMARGTQNVLKPKSLTQVTDCHVLAVARSKRFRPENQDSSIAACMIGIQTGAVLDNIAAARNGEHYVLTEIPFYDGLKVCDLKPEWHTGIDGYPEHEVSFTILVNRGDHIAQMPSAEEYISVTRLIYQHFY